MCLAACSFPPGGNCGDTEEYFSEKEVSREKERTRSWEPFCTSQGRGTPSCASPPPGPGRGVTDGQYEKKNSFPKTVLAFASNIVSN